MKLNPTFSKLAILAVVTLLLCYVLAEIGGLVRERQQRQREAAQGIEQSMAGAQVIGAPILLRDCRERWTVTQADKRETVETRDFQLMATASRFKASGGITPEARHRGLFKVNTYLAMLELEASWASLGALEPVVEHAGGRLSCSDPQVIFPVSDPRGIRTAQLSRGAQPIGLQPGAAQARWRGPQATLDGLNTAEPLALALKLQLVGSQQLGVVPAADDNQVALQSSWPHPSFTGQFLPVERSTGVSGFSARWQISSLASTAAADMRAGRRLPQLSTPDASPAPYAETPASKGEALDVMAVELVDPVNPYVMSDRAIKYGLMFIALTFITVGLTELLTGRRVHPVQYLLVGLALSLFFLLLLSLSEHLPFVAAYAVAAGAAAAVLTPYAAAMLGHWRRGAAFGGGIALLYGALYVLLSREQTALVIGAVLLFTVLAVVMTLTRKLDWYGLGAASQGQVG
jgi:inner membrane protein